MASLGHQYSFKNQSLSGFWRNLGVVAALVGGVAGGAEAGANKPETLYTEVSEPGETLDGFVLRITPRAAAVGIRLEAEVCGAIVAEGGGYKLGLVTTGEPNRCAIPNRRGTASLYHTHPQGGSKRPSGLDYDSGPGYVSISDGRVLAWTGRQDVRLVGRAWRGGAPGLAQNDEVRSYHIYEETSAPGENLDEFALRISPRAREVSRQMGAEICGALAPNIGGGWTIDMRTSNLKEACHIVTEKAFEQDFHTHPPGVNSNVSSSDYDHPGYMASYRGQLWHQQGRGTLRRVR